MTEYHLFFVFALGMLTTGACLTLHCFFMFMALRSQVGFRRWCPAASGAGLVVPSMLLAVALLVVSTFLQIGIWAALVILPRGRRF